MTKREAKKLPNGFYEIYWKNQYNKNPSLAAVGQTDKGDKWFSACHMTGAFAQTECWPLVERVVLIREDI